MKSILGWALGLGILALTGLILLILFGNLSGNVGFSSGTQGYNDTQNLITNYSTSVSNISVQFPTVGTIIGVALILLILLAVLIFAITKLMGVASGTVSERKSSSFETGGFG